MSYKLQFFLLALLYLFYQSAHGIKISDNLKNKLEKYHDELDQRMKEFDLINKNVQLKSSIPDQGEDIEINWQPQTFGKNEIIPLEYIVHVNKDKILKSIQDTNKSLFGVNNNLIHDFNTLGINKLQSQLLRDLHQSVAENRLKETESIHSQDALHSNNFKKFESEDGNQQLIDVEMSEIIPNSGIYKVQIIDLQSNNPKTLNNHNIFHSQLKSLHYIDNVKSNELLEYTKR